MQAHRPAKAAIYLRRSDSRQGMSIRKQLQLVVAHAARRGVSLDAQLADLNQMERSTLTQYKDIFLERSGTNDDLTK
jgi:hypothetical protein